MQKLNKYIYNSLFLNLLLIIISIIALINPYISLKIISYIIASFLIVLGMFFIIDYSTSIFFISFLPNGIWYLVLGIIIFMYPDYFMIIIPIILGLIIIMQTINNFLISLKFSNVDYKISFLSILLSVLTFILGIIIIVNPYESTLVLTKFISLFVLISCIINVIQLIIYKVNMKKVIKTI